MLQVLSRKLDNAVSVPVYGSQSAAVTAGSPAGETFLSGGDRCARHHARKGVGAVWKETEPARKQCAPPLLEAMGTACADATNFAAVVCRCVMWLGAPPEDKLPKDAAGGCTMQPAAVLYPCADAAHLVEWNCTSLQLRHTQAAEGAVLQHDGYTL